MILKRFLRHFRFGECQNYMNTISFHGILILGIYDLS